MRHLALLFLACVPLLSACPKDNDRSNQTITGSCDEQTCMDSCLRQGGAGTCSGGQCACSLPDAGAGSPDAGGATPGFLPGGACSCDAECAGTAANPGVCVVGVCMQQASAPCSASGSTAECGAGLRCWTLESSELSVCWPDCDTFECVGTCDSDGSCLPGRGSSCDPGCGTICPEPVTGDVGSPCASDDDCTAGGCYPETWGSDPTGFVGGYCMISGCTAASCPAGSACTSQVSGGTRLCMAECASDDDCRRGYKCRGDDGTCWPDCMDSTECPMGYTCRDYACTQA